MKIISIINLKGGCAKTTTALEIGHILHYRYGYRVLLVDNDKQGNLSRAMGTYDDNTQCQTAKLLSKEHIENMNVTTQEPGLGIMNANMSLLTATYRLTREEEPTNRFLGLRTARDEDGKEYDFVIIDNPPDLGLNVINALMVADDVIIPTRIDRWALDGMEIIKEQIEDIRKYNAGIKQRILVTMYKANEVNCAGVEWLEEQGYKCFHEKIRYSDKVAESILFGKRLEEYSPRSAAAVNYRRFVKEYLEMEDI